MPDKTIEELQKEFDDYKAQAEKDLKEKNQKLEEANKKAHDLEVKVSTLNELRLHEDTSGRKNIKSLKEDFE